MIVSRHKNAKGDFAVVRARTRNQALGNKETPFFLVRDLETKEYYFYVMSPTEYESNTTECKFELYPDGKGNFYLDQKLNHRVLQHYHTSYNDIYFFPTGSTDDYNTSKLYNGIPVYHMNTENFNVWLYQWSSDPSFNTKEILLDRRKMPQFQQNEKP